MVHAAAAPPSAAKNFRRAMWTLRLGVIPLRAFVDRLEKETRQRAPRRPPELKGRRADEPPGPFRGWFLRRRRGLQLRGLKPPARKS